MLPGMGRPIIFKCPQTGMNVQHWLADTEEGEKEAEKEAYVSVVCQACNRLHFINSSTGNLLGKAEK
jgi:hypothetical protein